MGVVSEPRIDNEKFCFVIISFSLLVVIQLVISTREVSIREIVVERSTPSSQLKVVYST